MFAADKLAIETAEQKNAVESYIYDMRSKLNENLSAFANEELRQKFSKLLEDSESWLYGDGEDVQKSAYSKKLEELKALGDPIVKRKFEDENRYEAVMQARKVIQNFQLQAESEVCGRKKEKRFLLYSEPFLNHRIPISSTSKRLRSKRSLMSARSSLPGWIQKWQSKISSRSTSIL
jgi:hypothetical protein